MPYAISNNKLAKYQQELIGEWSNRDIPGAKDPHGKPVGGEDNPLSYNIMPLPQESNPDGYILKNFKYYERLHFNDDNDKQTIASAAEAPNRGGLVSQNARAIFYEQQVRFAEGPQRHDVVHIENGMWLWLPRFIQQNGPYPQVDIDQDPVVDSLAQPATLSIAKQISVPHGNAVLALGSFDTVSSANGQGACKKDPLLNGHPLIPDAPFPYPMPEDPIYVDASNPPVVSKLNVDHRYTTEQSHMDDYQNPHPDLTQCPNKPLQQAVEYIKPESYLHWRVTTEALTFGRGATFNVPFEEQVAQVTDYFADYWLMYKAKHKYLAYTQTILMSLTIKGRQYTFPHVTCNTLMHH